MEKAREIYHTNAKDGVVDAIRRWMPVRLAGHLLPIFEPPTDPSTCMLAKAKDLYVTTGGMESELGIGLVHAFERLLSSAILSRSGDYHPGSAGIDSAMKVLAEELVSANGLVGFTAQKKRNATWLRWYLWLQLFSDGSGDTDKEFIETLARSMSGEIGSAMVIPFKIKTWLARYRADHNRGSKEPFHMAKLSPASGIIGHTHPIFVAFQLTLPLHPNLVCMFIFDTGSPSTMISKTTLERHLPDVKIRYYSPKELAAKAYDTIQEIGTASVTFWIHAKVPTTGQFCSFQFEVEVVVSTLTSFEQECDGL